MNAGNGKGKAMQTESICCYNAFLKRFFAFQTPVRVTEPNPNWSTVGATWPQKRVAMGARDYSSGAHNHTNKGPTPASTVLPSLFIFNFNHWEWRRSRIARVPVAEAFTRSTALPITIQRCLSAVCRPTHACGELSLSSFFWFAGHSSTRK